VVSNGKTTSSQYIYSVDGAKRLVIERNIGQPALPPTFQWYEVGNDGIRNKQFMSAFAFAAEDVLETPSLVKVGKNFQIKKDQYLLLATDKSFSMGDQVYSPCIEVELVAKTVKRKSIYCRGVGLVSTSYEGRSGAYDSVAVEIHEAAVGEIEKMEINESYFIQKMNLFHPCVAYCAAWATNNNQLSFDSRAFNYCWGAIEPQIPNRKNAEETCKKDLSKQTSILIKSAFQTRQKIDVYMEKMASELPQ